MGPGCVHGACIRFEQYRQWPYKAWQICSKFNPDGYSAACMDFLSIPSEQLDEGFSIPFRQLALAEESDAAVSAPGQDAARRLSHVSTSASTAKCIFRQLRARSSICFVGV